MVPESIRKAGPFHGAGQTQFDFDFYMLSADDVVVIVADADDNESTLAKEKYTCTLYPDQNTTPGGRVTLKTALAAGHKLAICSGVPYTQNLNLTMYGNFNPTTINKEEDRRVIQIQQLAEQLMRCLKVPSTSNKTPEELLKEIFEAAEDAIGSAKSAAIDAVRSENAADRAESGAQRVEDILANYESGVICKSFTASDSRWKQVSTAYGPKYRLVLNIGSTALIGVYSGTTDNAEKVITGVLLSGENVTIEVPEPFTGFLFTAMLTKKVADYVYVKAFTEEDFRSSGARYVLSVPASEHKCGKTPAIVELVKITGGRRERFYAYDEVDAEGNLQITVSEPFDGELVLDGGYLREEI